MKSPNSEHRQHPSRLAKLIACALLTASGSLYAEEEVEYESTFLVGGAATSLDLSRYKDGNPTSPGNYEVQVYVNNQAFASLPIDFIELANKRSAEACITPQTLVKLRLRQPERDGRSGALREGASPEEDCLDLAQLIPQSSVEYDNSDQRLMITVPQASLVKGFENYVDPSLWEEGINAAMLSYDMNAWRSDYAGEKSDSFYAGLYAGINLGNWHFRSHGNYNWNKNGGSQLEFQNRYLQRDIVALHAQIQLGETYTTGETFDSVQIKGMRLYSDPRMLPPTLANYSPTVRGVANSNAKITIMQGNYKIYETTVPPGPFEIDDLSPSGYGSDLVITIEEADGSKRSFIQPFSSVIQMMHPGVGRWDISAGQVNKTDLHENPNVAQASWYYGLNNMFTGYTGVQATDNGYLAGLVGLGINTTLGAFSLDMTHSSTDIPDEKRYQGQSYRVSWNKFFEATATSLNIAAYRYSTENYLGLNDALLLIDTARHPDKAQEAFTPDNYARMKNQFSISINQTLQHGEQDYGSFYLTGSWTDYWVTHTSRSDFSLGYSKGFDWGSFSLNLQRSYDESSRKDDRLFVNVTIPLEKLFNRERNSGGFRNFQAGVSSDMKGANQYSMSASGGSADNQLSYSVNAGYDANKEGVNISSVSGYLGYQTPWGTWTGSASASSDDNRQYSMNTSGGFVLHRGGLTHSNDGFTDNDTLVLVNAPGAKGARINYGNSTIDRWGYGVSNSLSAYRENNLTLDVGGLENDVELKSTSTVLIPRAGAVILSQFETDEGRSAIMTIVRSDNKPLPFSTEIYNAEGKLLGNVGQGGQAWIRGIEESGTLELRWKEESSALQCRVRYQLPENPKMLDKTLLLDTATCQM